MKGLFQSNKIYCVANIFACILCTGYLYTGYCNVNNNVHHGKTIETVDVETEPLSKTDNSSEKKSSTTSTKTVVTKAKTTTSSKKYVKAKYDAVTGNAVVEYAKKYLGLRYVSGGNSLSTGTDCSGFTKLIYQEFGITLSRSVKSQARNGSYVKKSDLKKGDLIFYGYKSGVVSHVAIYIGDGQVIHQSTPKSGVKINTMNMMVYITARRVITERSSSIPEETLGDSKEPTKEENNNVYTENEFTQDGADNSSNVENESNNQEDVLVESENNSQNKVEEEKDNSQEKIEDEKNTSLKEENKTYTNSEYGTSK